jgi:hypothetical protein
MMKFWRRKKIETEYRVDTFLLNNFDLFDFEDWLNARSAEGWILQNVYMISFRLLVIHAKFLS